MSLAACIIRCPCTTRSPCCRYRLLGRYASRTDAVASLTCRKSGSCCVPSLQQDDERAGAHAAHTDHLAGHVHDLEALEQVAPVVLQGGPVGAELLADRRVDLVGRQAVRGGQVAQRHDDRRLADDPVRPVDELAELGQRLQAVAGVSLRTRLLRPLGRRFSVSFSCFFAPFLPSDFLAAFAACFASRPPSLRIAVMSSSSSRCAYQMSIVRIGANCRHRLPVGRHRGQRRSARVRRPRTRCNGPRS